jgi:hypothetical protein
MPAIEDWKIRPYATIQKIFEENEGCSHEELINKIEEYFTQVLDTNSLSQLPSLNSVPLDQLRTGTLVKYRCMVQDVFDPQLCFSQYKVTNSETQASRIELGLFCDISSLAPSETIDFSSKDSVTVERNAFYCVPIPGESEWVKQAHSKFCKSKILPSSSSTARPKREREDEANDLETLQKSSRDEIAETMEMELKETNNSIPETESCAAKGESQAISNTDVLMKNLPLPDEKGIPCIVRVYSKNVEIRATDAVEIIGILSVDPQLAYVYDDSSQMDAADREELQAHEPPPSLVPRLHALLTKHLQHNNPILSPNPASDQYKLDLATLMEDACSLHLELLSIFEHALFGDRLAAEYLLCNLVSNVYGRADEIALGKLSVNISGCPAVQKYAALLHHLISQLVPQSVLIDMSLENVNTLRLIPSKDYTLNRLTAGMLQLANGTHLVLNETALHQGHLNRTGIANIKALADLINWQKVEYDYQWHPIPIPCDIPVIVLSDGESLLPKDVHIPLAMQGEVHDMIEHFCKLDSRLTEDNLSKLRSYITACRLGNYSLSEELQKVMQEDFVEIRQVNPKDMSVDDFHRLLGLMRALTLSFGQTACGIEMWAKAKTMEEARKERVANLPRAHHN